MEIRNVKKVTDYKHLNMFEISYLDRDRNEKSWQIASRSKDPKCVSGQFDMPDAVVIVPMHTEEGKLVLIKEFRVPLGDYQYGFPAGLIDEGESIQDACQRELKEETGLDVARFLRMSPPIYSSTGMTDESVAMIHVECEGIPSNKDNTSSEDIVTLMVSSSEAFRLSKDSKLKFDVKTWLVLSYFAENGEICF
ncbi:MAG: NUDIX hydrolase [Proteobacteria bacterium]|nr:NUDIX hydrolase [Pseudomonadota bacterium]